MLKQVQEAFLDGLFLTEDVPNFIDSPQPKARFNIYRQTIFLNLQQSLSLTFPGIWKLLGQDCANSIAYAFYAGQRQLPITGCLDDYGFSFPSFLQTISQLESYPYLSDYANYEWIKHQVEHEKTEQPLSIEDISSLPDDDWENASFLFIDAFKMCSSSFPLDEIQQLLMNPSIQTMQLRSKSSYAIVMRPQQELLTYWITQDKWLFIHLLWKGDSIQKSMEIILKHYPTFNFAETLSFIFQHHMIKKIRRAAPCVSIK